jgi:hypothetical protein
MFCPKCSQPQPTDGVRFCPRCGFRLDGVRELFEHAEARAEGEARPPGGLPPQRYISLGAALMFAGTVPALLWGLLEPSRPPDLVLPQAYFLLGTTLVFILTLFHPLLGALQKLFSDGDAPPVHPRRRDGINLGALLMFLAALKAMLFASFVQPGEAPRALLALVFCVNALLLLLVLRPLLRGLHSLLFKGEAEAAPDPGTRIDPPARAAAALPHARSVPVEDFATPRVNTAEIVTPPASVTEETTRKLNNF